MQLIVDGATDQRGKFKVRSKKPGRKTANSVDLRWTVVWQRLALHLTLRAIASNLSLSAGTAHNIFKRFEDTGEVNPNQLQKERN